MFVRWPIRVEALGFALPSRMVDNAVIGAAFGVSEAQVFAASGVRTRPRVSPGEPEDDAAELGARAAKDALARASLDANNLDLIINASGTPQQALPDGAAFIQRAIGLGTSGIACVSVHSTCLSFLSALQHAGAMIQAGLYKCVLVVSAEAGSVGLHPQDLETQALIGDGAAAAILVPSKDMSSSIEAVHFETYGQGVELTRIRGGGSRHPPQDPNTTLEHNTFDMEGLGLIKLVLRRLPAFLARAFPEGLDAFDHIVPHQASPATFRVLERVGAPMHRVHSTLETLGNCIAASIPLTFALGVREGRIQRGERVLLIGTGAGVSIGAVSIKF